MGIAAWLPGSASWGAELIQPGGTTTALLALLLLLTYLGMQGKGKRTPARVLPKMPFVESLTDAYEDMCISIDLAMKGLLKPHYILSRLAQKYGPIYSINLIFTRIIVISGYDTIREAFQNPDINDRPVIHVLKRTIPGNGIAFSSGPAWKVQRKMVLNFLRAFGVNRASFDQQIAAEAGHLCAAVRGLDGRPFDPSHLLANAVSNVICSVVFGRRYDYADPRFGRLLHATYRNVANIGGAHGPLQLMPFAHLLMPIVPVLKETADNGKLMCDFAREVLEDHRADREPGNPRDFTDVFLEKLAETAAGDRPGGAATSPGRADGSGTGDVDGLQEDEEDGVRLTVDDMCATASDLFIAGTETTSVSLRWGLLHLLARPDVLRRVQEELDSVVGRDRMPRIADRPRLPYTEATLAELQRVANIFPLGIPHRASRDTTVAGLDVPRGSIVMPNMWSLTHNAKLWAEPEVFRPERFLDESGRTFIKHEALIPFSTGRRMCVGERLARMELFIILTHLFHQFDFRRPEGAPPISFKGVMGVTLSPLPFQVCAVPRD